MGLPIVFLGGLWVQDSLGLDELFRDPLDVALGTGHGEIHYGLMSNLGNLLWCATGAICLFAALQTRDIAPARHAGCLLAAGGLSLLLMSDDMFYGHEVVYPQLLGLRETHVVSTYMALTVAYLIVFRDITLGRENTLLIMSLLLFAISVVTDLFWQHDGRAGRMLEDGSKFAGIIAWSGHHLRLSWLITRR